MSRQTSWVVTRRFGVSVLQLLATGSSDRGNAQLGMTDTEPAAAEPPSQRQRVTRLLIVLLLFGVLVFVIVDQVLKPCVVHETTSQNATTNCSDSAPDDCRTDKACASVFLEEFIDWVGENPAAGAVLLAGVYVVAAVCFVPGSILTLGAGAAFSSALGLGWGVVVGTIAVWVGAAVGGLVSFALGRFALHRLVNRLLQRWKLTAALDAALRDEGLKLMVLLRLSPLIPFNALNYVLAGTTACSKCPLGSAPASSAPVPPQGAPGGSGQLGTPRKRPAHWIPSHCLGCSSEPPPKLPISRALTMQARASASTSTRWRCLRCYPPPSPTST